MTKITKVHYMPNNYILEYDNGKKRYIPKWVTPDIQKTVKQLQNLRKFVKS